MSATKYFKTIYTVTVLTEDRPINPDMDIVDVIHEITDGDSIGNVSMESVSEIPTDKIEDELLAIGNDGTFFSCGGESDEEGTE